MSTNLLDLPQDVFERIFVYLSLKDVLRFECASMLCHSLSRVYFWRQFSTLNLMNFLKSKKCSIDVDGAYKFDLVAGSLMRRVGAGLTDLKLSKFGPLEYGLNLGFECAVVESCRNLQALELTNRLLDKDWLYQAILAMPNLKSLSLNRLYIRSYGELDDKILFDLLKMLTKLQCLSIRNNKKVHLNAFDRPDTLPPTLSDLDAQDCVVSAKNVGDALKRCPNLLSLCLMLQVDFRSIDAQLLAKLRHLSLDSNHRLSTHGFLDALNETMGHLLRSTVSLRSLTLPSHLTSDFVFKEIGNSLKNLTHLKIFGSKNDFVAKPIAAFSRLAKLPKLVKISLPDNESAWLFLTICQKCKFLTEIDVSFSIRCSSVKNSDWDRVKSASLSLLVMKNFAPASADRREISCQLLTLLKPNCPRLNKISI